MAKLNQTLRGNRLVGVRGAITSETTASGRTHQGGAGYVRDSQGELFLLAVTNFVGEDTFYEGSSERDARYRNLVAACATIDPQWTADLLGWLRTKANMRSASIVGAIEAARALAAAGTDPAGVTPRRLVDSVLQRADEPGEALAYWHANYGRTLPKWFKRALGDAAVRLYTPYSYAKWDSDRNIIRFADVIEVSQLKRHRGDNTGLFKFILDSRPGTRRAPITGDVSTVPMLAARARITATPAAERRAFLLAPGARDRLRDAGLTWEAVSGWLQGQMDAQAWEAAIPIMGYGALIKNLANFERAGISKAARTQVIDRLTDPVGVSKSRLLPMAFLNAYNNVPGDTFKAALDEAATRALAYAPTFSGQTLVLVDTSTSMNDPFTSARTRRRPVAEQLMRWDAAALFGIALARTCAAADIISFSNAYFGRHASTQFNLRAGENLLAAVARFRKTHFLGGGTDTAAAVRRWYAGHDRVVCLTDEQADQDGHGVYAAVPANVPVYTFNLAGYRYGHAASGPNRFVVGGLSDAGFAMIAALEARVGGTWPWQT